MSENKKVLEYAKKMGYESAYFRLEWKGYNVYQPVYSDELAYIGLPLMILEKDGKFRMTDVDESFEILDITAEEDERISEVVGDEYIEKISVWDKIKGFFIKG